MSAMFTCSMCGHRFASGEGTAACGSCPLQGRCRLVCCPSCGHTIIDPALSTWARAVANMSSWLRRRRWPSGSLAGIGRGARARIVALTEALAPVQWEHLQAYGLNPGAVVTVLQQAPTTIIRVERTEIAMERRTAGRIQVSVLGLKKSRRS